MMPPWLNTRSTGAPVTGTHSIRFTKLASHGYFVTFIFTIFVWDFAEITLTQKQTDRISQLTKVNYLFKILLKLSQIFLYKN